MTPTTIVFLHALGYSRREWDQVVALLPAYDCIALDLPGFGDRLLEGRTDVAAMADRLVEEIAELQPTACVLVGHSMGGKIATLVAARAASAESGLEALRGVILVAASPPAPEPMDEDRRAEMLGWFTDGHPTRDDAATFVDANTAQQLSSPLREQAMADVLRCDPAAWTAWLEHGSREDWSDRVGQIALPALIVAGAQDGDLGEPAQRRLNAPHYQDARVEVIADAAHLIPYEQPQTLAALIDRHVAFVTGASASHSHLSPPSQN